MSVNPNAPVVSNNNFWSPENIARRAGRVQQQAAAEQATQQAATEQDFMATVGQTLRSIVSGYTSRMRSAETSQVERDFYQAFPQAGPSDFRQSVDTLKQAGVLYERQGEPGLMGMRTTSLYVLS